jgi:hypothetical protein
MTIEARRLHPRMPLNLSGVFEWSHRSFPNIELLIEHDSAMLTSLGQYLDRISSILSGAETSYQRQPSDKLARILTLSS